MLSEIDYAGSGYRLCEAINQHTDHDIRIFTGKYYNPFGFPDNSKWERRFVQDRINESDIVHLKGDFPPVNGRCMGFNISHKPIMITVSGSHFRKKEHGGYEKYTLKDYDGLIKTAFTHDLLYEGFDIWIPHPIDSTRYMNAWKCDEPMMLHIPSRRDVKGTAFVEKVFAKLEAKGIKCSIREKVIHKEAIELKKECCIYFDQFNVGFYGNSAIEAMQYGIPVAAWIRDHLPGCPVISEPRDVDMWVSRILKVLGNDMRNLSVKTKYWCDTVHGYQAVAEKVSDIYDFAAI